MSTVRHSNKLPKPNTRGKPRVYQFDGLKRKGDFVEFDATYRTIHTSINRYFKKNKRFAFQIEVVSRDPARVKVWRLE